MLERQLPHERLGEITLHPHQRVGAARVLQMLAQHGGALLADEVGLGKTYVALAVSRAYQGVLVLAPAALRATWIAAAGRAAVDIEFRSLEGLSRTQPEGANAANAALVIVDEAHHLRNPRTKRFAATVRICDGADVLLLSATPIQNRLRDMRAVLSLFLGEHAYGIPSDRLSAFVIRRGDGDLTKASGLRLPRVLAPAWIPAPPDTDCLARIVGLPPPVPPVDGGLANTLITFTLVRLWASTRGALRAGLRRRLALARAMEDALASGRRPSRAEIGAWCLADEAQQLAFPELTVSSEIGSAAVLTEQVIRHADALRDLLSLLASTPDPDLTRARLVLDLQHKHPGERMVVFSEYAESVAAVYRLLLSQARVAMLTHRGGRVASGAISRAEVLRCFADRSARKEAERIDLLCTTDVLSEGVDLHSASVVVHLDLCWNPARLDQRVGRLRRIGAARDVISVYAMQPPDAAERLLTLERRLQEKRSVAARSVGVSGAILPGAERPAMTSDVGEHERLVQALVYWRRARADLELDETIVTAVRSTRSGAIAAICSGDVVTVMAYDRCRVMDASRDVLPFVLAADGPETTVNPAFRDESIAALRAELRRNALARPLAPESLHVARMRRGILRRIDAIAIRLDYHRRGRMAPLIGSARTAVAHRLSPASERRLADLAESALGDDEWLRAVAAFSPVNVRGQPPEILALLLLQVD